MSLGFRDAFCNNKKLIMKQIYTKTGDEGMTSLRDGVRVSKDDPRIEANGQIDQLNAHLGIVRSMLHDDDEDSRFILAVQRELMTVMSHIATPEGCQSLRKAWPGPWRQSRCCG